MNSIKSLTIFGMQDHADDANRQGIGVRLGATTGDLKRNMKSLQVSRSITPDDGVISRTLTKISPVKEDQEKYIINLQNNKFDNSGSIAFVGNLDIEEAAPHQPLTRTQRPVDQGITYPGYPNQRNNVEEENKIFK